MVIRKERGLTVCRCDWVGCGKEFTRRTAEVNRSVRLGMPQFDSRSCATKWRNAHATEPMRQASRSNIMKFGVSNNRRDELSPFRYFHIIIRNRRRKDGEKRQVEVSVEDLAAVWEEQEGKCPYTGIDMVLPRGTGAGWTEDTPVYKRPSLDRIDSSKEYIKGNVQFISQMANLAKNSHSHEEMVEFCRAIAEHWA